jgi:hypothetical protein
MKQIVQVREVHVSRIEVEADSQEAAILLVRRLGHSDAGKEIALKHSHTLDHEWTVYTVKN